MGYGAYLLVKEVWTKAVVGHFVKVGTFYVLVLVREIERESCKLRFVWLVPRVFSCMPPDWSAPSDGLSLLVIFFRVQGEAVGAPAEGQVQAGVGYAEARRCSGE